MKNIFILFTTISLLYACKKEETTPGGGVIHILANIAIVDETFNDRLNPESASYFGAEFCKEIFIISDERRWRLEDIIKHYGGEYLDYYFFPLPGTQIRICYPDGSEDEIKIQIIRLRTRFLTYDKLWVNGELASDRGCGYYNSKYYPAHWLYPVYDSKGVLQAMYPTNYTLVITK